MITIFYQCPTCKRRRPVEIPERHAATTILYWMNQVVMPRVYLDHQQFRCPGTHVDLIMPAEEDRLLGQVDPEKTYEKNPDAAFEIFDRSRENKGDEESSETAPENPPRG
jgi:hypothetical protein